MEALLTGIWRFMQSTAKI